MDKVIKGSNMLKVKKIVNDAIIPKYASAEAAGFDLSSIEDVEIQSQTWKIVKTGLAFEIPQGFEVQIRSRSGLAAKNGVMVLNSPGTIDSDYINEIMVILFNHGVETFYVKRGDRIAQGVLKPVIRSEIVEITDFSKDAVLKDRGGGLGSTGLR